jgi:hypothetical protein
MTGLVDRKVEVRCQFRQLDDVVLEADRKASRVRRRREELVVVELRLRRDGQPGIIGQSIDKIWINAIAALAACKIQPSKHD